MVIAKKRFGQNFLIDKNISRKIVDLLSITNEDHIIEIGPGMGALTKLILEKKPKSLDVIEIDKACIAEIRELDCNIHEDDALIFDFKLFHNKYNKKLKIISNLPYNIGTKIITNFLSQYRNIIDKMVFMVQKEVAERIIGKPFTKEYGSLSIFAQYSSKIKKNFDVSANCFFPKPKITSSILSFEINENFDEKIFNNIQKITKILFQNRRKQIKPTYGNFRTNYQS